VKAKPESHFRRFGPIKLHREEIEEIIAVFTNACGTVELSDEKHVYDSLDEMDNRLGKTFSRLVITGSSPYMSLALGTKKLTWWVRQDDDHLYAEEGEKAAAPFLRVQDMVLQHESVLRFFFNYAFFVCIFALDWALPWVRHSYFHLSAATNEIAWRAQMILFGGYFLAWTYFINRGISRLSLTPRSKRQSFWERNGDNLAMILLGAVIGIIGTLAAEGLKRTFWPK